MDGNKIMGKKDYKHEQVRTGPDAELNTHVLLCFYPQKVKEFIGFEKIVMYNKEIIYDLSKQLEGVDGEVFWHDYSRTFDVKNDQNVGISKRLLLELARIPIGENKHNWINYKNGWAFNCKADWILFTNILHTTKLYVVQAQPFISRALDYDGPGWFIDDKTICPQKTHRMVNKIVPEEPFRNLFNVYDYTEYL